MTLQSTDQQIKKSTNSSLTFGQLRALLEQGIEGLKADAEVGPIFTSILRAVNGNEHAALCALDVYGHRPFVRQVRALSQLLTDSIAHALRQPGQPSPISIPAAVAVALGAAQPLSLIEDQALNPS